jgi:hypothetical protein
VDASDSERPGGDSFATIPHPARFARHPPLAGRDGRGTIVHNIGFNFQTAHSILANAALPQLFATRGRRFPFSFSPYRGDGAPGGAREPAKLPSPALRSAGVTHQDSGTQVIEGVGVPGRAGSQALRALRLPALQRGDIVGRRTSLRHPTPLKTTPSMSKVRTR